MQSVNSSMLSLENAKSKLENGIGNKLDLLEAKTQLARDKQFLLDKKIVIKHLKIHFSKF